MKDRVRNSVKAVNYPGGENLLVQKADILGAYTVLPGGGQRAGEPCSKALGGNV
jgi:hypothetical protein